MKVLTVICFLLTYLFVVQVGTCAETDRFQQVLSERTNLTIPNSGYVNPNQSNGAGLATSLQSSVILRPGYCAQLMNGALRQVQPAVRNVEWGSYWEGPVTVDRHDNYSDNPGHIIHYDVVALAELCPAGTVGSMLTYFEQESTRLVVAPPSAYGKSPSGEDWSWVYTDYRVRPGDRVGHEIREQVLRNDLVCLAPNVVEQDLLLRETHTCTGYKDDAFSEGVLRYIKTGAESMHVDEVLLLYDHSGKMVDRIVAHADLHPGPYHPLEMYLNPDKFFPQGSPRTIRPNAPGNRSIYGNGLKID